jgi:hypothetical protein
VFSDTEQGVLVNTHISLFRLPRRYASRNDKRGNEDVEDIEELSDYFILFCIDQKRNKKI